MLPLLPYSWARDNPGHGRHRKVKGQWKYLYRALDSQGNTIDFYLSSTRNTQAAKRFLSKALRRFKDWEKPRSINTDKAPAYTAAIKELNEEMLQLYLSLTYVAGENTFFKGVKSLHFLKLNYYLNYINIISNILLL